MSTCAIDRGHIFTTKYLQYEIYNTGGEVKLDRTRSWLLRILGIPITVALITLAICFLAKGYIWNAFAIFIQCSGSALNLLAFFSNNKKMPAKGYAPEDETVLSCALTEGTRFPMLADRLYFGNARFSIGDILMASGLILFFSL